MGLLYLALPSVELSHQRVAERVAHGGHAIAPEDIDRRFPRSLRNLLEVYSGAVDYAQCFMNIGRDPEIVFYQGAGERTIINQMLYDQLAKGAHR